MPNSRMCRADGGQKSPWGKSGTRSVRNLTEPLERFTPCAELWCDAPPWPSWSTSCGPLCNHFQILVFSDGTGAGVAWSDGEPENAAYLGDVRGGIQIPRPLFHAH